MTRDGEDRDRSGAVAIVGIGCRFPGGVRDVASFWQLLTEGRDAIGEIPADRMDVTRYFDPRQATPGKMSTRWGGYLDRIADMDAGFFGLSPLEAARMDPQHRLLLETAWEALEDAGLDTAVLEGRRAGVFVGQWLSDFEGRLFEDPTDIDFYMTLGSGRYAASGRLSYLLGLRGPSVTLDTACSSSLAAVHLAVQSLRSGESEVALAGAANVILQPHITIAYSQSRMMAPDGRCKFGDAKANGYVRSEGAAMLVMKPLARAIADGDSIHAVIRGTALNNDGRSSGSLGTPSPLGQEELLRSAYRDAGVAPADVGYVEAHGTGTLAGDPVELAALGRVLGEERNPATPLLVGSVKTNIGHTEGAAGAAGLIKAALCVKHGVVPASLHCTTPSPSIPWSELPCRIAQVQTPWPDRYEARVAGVSAFGIAGTNVHVVLEAPPLVSAPQAAAAVAPFILALSARAPGALAELAAKHVHLISRVPEALGDVCWNAATRRTALDHRAAFVAADAGDMIDRLKRYAAGEATAATGQIDASTPRKVAFVLPGQGGQWAGMARALLRSEPDFREAIVACDQAARNWCDWSVLGVLEAEPETAGKMLERIDVIQPVLVAVAIGYAALLRGRGIVPDAVVGHSMGEVAAAHIAGALDLASAMRVICRRSILMRAASGAGAMALLDIGAEDAQLRIAGLDAKISLAASNSPRSTVISGDPAAVAQVMAGCEADGIYTRLVKVDVASHSPQMEPVARSLAAELADLTSSPQRVAIYSTADAQRAPHDPLDAGYWARNVRQPVRFAAAISAMLVDGISTFIELGPHPVLLHAIEQTAQWLDKPAATISCGRREEPEPISIASMLAQLWALGHPLDFRRVMPAGGRFVALPLYPWQRERHWVEQAELRPAAESGRRLPAKLDDATAQWLYRLDWEACEPKAERAASASDGQRMIVVAVDEAHASPFARALATCGAEVSVASFAGLQRVLAAGSRPFRGLLALCPSDRASAYLPVQLLQALLQGGDGSGKLWLLTHGAQTVNAQDPPPSIDGAAAWGAARVVGEEHPDLWGGLIDLDPTTPAAQDAEAIARHIVSGDDEDQLAWRGGKRFALRLVADKTSGGGKGAYAWRADASYLITGGFGGVSLLAAEEMARGGARRIILMARTPIPPRADWREIGPHSAAGKRIAAVQRLEAMGVAVHTAAVDAGSETALGQFLDAWRAEGWPPIKGVVHAAVALDNHLAAKMDRRSFDIVMRAKLDGARLIDRMLPDLDILVLFSSMAGTFPHVGIANYAAANAGLDAFAIERTARGLATISIAWGPWRDRGLHAKDSKLSDDFAREGIASLEADTGMRLFAHLVAGYTGARVVMSVDWQRYQEARAGRALPLIRKLAGRNAQQGETTTADLGALGTRERKSAIDALVRDAVVKTLRIAPERLDPRKAFGTMGLTSLLAMELRNRLEAALKRPLPATLAWNHPTVEALVLHLATLIDAPAAARPPEAPQQRSQAGRVADDLNARLAEIASLSDDEALAALRGT